jgi:hypothetical protein
MQPMGRGLSRGAALCTPALLEASVFKEKFKLQISLVLEFGSRYQRDRQKRSR